MKEPQIIVQGEPASTYAYPLGKAEGVVWTVDSGYPTLKMVAEIDFVTRYFRTASFRISFKIYSVKSYIITMWMCKVGFNFFPILMTLLLTRKKSKLSGLSSGCNSWKLFTVFTGNYLFFRISVIRLICGGPNYGIFRYTGENPTDTYNFNLTTK